MASDAARVEKIRHRLADLERRDIDGPCFDAGDILALLAELDRLTAELHPPGTYKCGCPLAAMVGILNFCPTHMKTTTGWEASHVSLPPKESP